MKNYRFLLLLFSLITILGCNKCSQDKPNAIVLVDKPDQINEKVTELLENKLSKIDTAKETLVISKDSLFATKLIFEFYNKNKYAVTWTDQGILTKQGDTLFNIIKNADDYGLIPKDYHFTKIDSLLHSAKDSLTKKFDAVKICDVDILLTDAFFTFAVHVCKGRLNADSLTREWKLSQMDTNLVEILNTVFKKNSIRSAIDSLEPKNEQYRALKLALKNFKYEFKDVDWDSIASRNSDSTTFMARVKARLIKSHDYFDEFSGSDSIKLVKSIKNFQCKNNLIEDGKIGKLTFKALQRTKKDYIRQIELNMERWRWYKPPYEKQYVWVNIPKFEMHVTEHDTLVMRSRVIIGEPEKQTPLLKSTIRYFLIYPYWTVPYKIATEEILPILKRDSSYLRRKNFDVLDGRNQKLDASTINWKKYKKTYFPFKLRQGIGEDNSLGILKFNFENKYGVYMHDTDNHRLFGREMRALSHGCCRLEKFMQFTKLLIRDDSVRYPVDSLLSDISKAQQKYVYIKHPIAIYINYFTVEIDEYNEIHYFIDVYKRDEKMLRSLDRRKK
ncbi:MAG: L,D-transpeptidase family protein [Bacteroidia bacterium]